MAFRDGSGANAGRVERKGSRDPLLGTVINGKFHVERAIARGGMGRIYYGTQAPLGRPVALKIVKADTVNEEESQFLKRFLLEASILAKLQHPNVVTLFDYGLIEGAPVEMYFIAMEYLNGETLTERLRTRGALPAHEALVLFRQIARGLREAHVRGIVHRDLEAVEHRHRAPNPTARLSSSSTSGSARTSAAERTSPVTACSSGRRSTWRPSSSTERHPPRATSTRSASSSTSS